MDKEDGSCKEGTHTFTDLKILNIEPGLQWRSLSARKWSISFHLTGKVCVVGQIKIP